MTFAPDAILFNGGFFIPAILRERVADVLEKWYGPKPLLLENHDLDLAVAIGAAYYANVRATGQGVLVRGGLPRSYYIGLDQTRAVTLVPRGAEEGSTVTVDPAGEGLRLIANRPVSFRLYSSLSRVDDLPGSVVAIEPDFNQHAPLDAVIRFGKPTEERQVPIQLTANLTAIGTLELFADSKISEHRWKLEFQLRRAGVQAATKPRAATVISDDAVAAAEKLITDCFARAFPPEELPGKLEQAVGLGRGSWPLATLRRLADVFLSVSDQRNLSAAHEFRWLSLAGFCLRPGFGAPGDDLRIEQARRVYAAGLAFPSAVQNEIEWWIFWGRVAGGLNRNQQTDVYQRISSYLLPRGSVRPPRVNTSLRREMWRTASSLELLPVGTKTELGEGLIKQVKANQHTPSDFWCLARLGARQLFHGPNNLVLPATTIDRWVSTLASVEGAAEAIAQMAQSTGDNARDVTPSTLELARQAIAKHKDADSLKALLEGGTGRDLASLGRVYGEDLPSGLVFND